MKGKKPMQRPGLQRKIASALSVKQFKKRGTFGLTTLPLSSTPKQDSKTGTPTTSECSPAPQDTKLSAKIATAEKLGVKIQREGHFVKVNAAKCKRCCLVLISLHRHDFRQCNCADGKNVFIDGGSDGFGGGGYLRVGGDAKQIMWLPLYYRLDEPEKADD